MKNHVFLLCGIFVIFAARVSCYPERINFASNVIKKTSTVGEQSTVAPCTLEPRQDGSPSRVQLVRGKEAFQRYIVNQSHKKPVVAKFFSDSKDSMRVKNPFQETADVFGGEIDFFAVDIEQQNNGTLENQNVLVQLMVLLGLSKIDLPIFFFFKNGSLCSPSPMLQGFYTKENLEAFIKNKFFLGKQGVIASGVQPMSGNFLDNSVTYPRGGN